VAEAVGGYEGWGDQEAADDGGVYVARECSDNGGPGGEDIRELEDGGEGRADHPAAALVVMVRTTQMAMFALGELGLRPSTR
jgi:hypothetical protein